MKAECPSQPVQKQLLFPPGCSSPAPRRAGRFPHCRGERSFTSPSLLNHAAWAGERRRSAGVGETSADKTAPPAVSHHGSSEEGLTEKLRIEPVHRGEADSADLVLLSAWLFGMARVGLSWSVGRSLLGSAAARPLCFRPCGHNF